MTTREKLLWRSTAYLIASLLASALCIFFAASAGAAFVRTQYGIAVLFFAMCLAFMVGANEARDTARAYYWLAGDE